MGAYSATRHLPYTAQQLFALAADVAEYPNFVPLCQSARIWGEETDEKGVRRFDAALVVAYEKLGIHEEFISHVIADPNILTVTSQANKGPVKNLTSHWIFRDAPKHGGCTVSYDVDFRMRSAALNLVMNAAFNKVVDKVMNAFDARAHELYGAPQ
ncbi:MAG: type II toxin-antitoxin system RatA family toxin [Hyphomicrobiales bacterium]